MGRATQRLSFPSRHEVRELALGGRAVLFAHRKSAWPSGCPKSSFSSNRSRTRSSARRQAILCQSAGYPPAARRGRQTVDHDQGSGSGRHALAHVPLDMSFARCRSTFETRMPTSGSSWTLFAATRPCSCRRDEVEAAWRWVDPILAAWSDTEAGSAGLYFRHLGTDCLDRSYRTGWPHLA